MKYLLIVISTFLFNCSDGSNENSEPTSTEEEPMGDKKSGVVGVSISGEENAYTFSVTIASPDTGCDQYANWWEVITEDGELLYRRILAHSHVKEQPFTRSGGPINITEDQEVIIRFHMNNTGYSPYAMKGSVNISLEKVTLDSDFFKDLGKVNPLPKGCAF